MSIQRTVPIVAIRGSVIFPHTDSILSFGRSKSIEAVNASFQDDKIIAVFNQKDSNTVDPKVSDLYEIGTIATVSQMMSTDDEIHAMIKGQARVHLDQILAEEPYFIGKVSEITETEVKTDEVVALANQLLESFKKAVNLGKGVEITTVMKILSGQIEPVELVDCVSSLLDIKSDEKQKLLEMLSVKNRFKEVIQLMGHEVNILDLERTISMKTQKKLEEQMKKAMLREKKKVIEEELDGSDGQDANEIKELKKKIKQAKMPKDTETKALKELKRLDQMSPNNPESGYVRNYLDWLIDVPWSIESANNVSVAKASKVLESEHYAIDKTKERILEYLSVMKMKEKARKSQKDEKSITDDQAQPTILCFIGPPGVGKTSIGRSIAKALGRKFARVSLGGIRDEAEIRGHRRTYVGAMPGRIIQGIKNAGTKNPVFMLDEIDKLGVDYRGDPSSALLEILDPEQNKEFSDHYLEVPFDLSKVMFIATGNVTDTIPGPLLDRMEVIRFAGYTTDEKFQIAMKFLWQKQIRQNAIEDMKIKLDKDALIDVIENYTREAGVRNLERNLATICRKVARLIAEKKAYPKVIKVANIRKFLGPKKFSSQIAEKEDEIGMVTGLAVTGFGGEIMFIEVSLMPGSGKLILTGQLGSVMKESAKAAFTWTRSHYNELGLMPDFAKDKDIHIHVPEGATPKDGPSAGVSMTTALVSAVTGLPVRIDLAMTGEVTLRGRVLEIGGVKEKVIAAHRAGIKTIILPKDNQKDMDDVPPSVKKDVKFYFVEHYEEIPPIAIKGWPPTMPKSKRVPASSFIAAA